jgi:hypothetical protein
MFSDRKEDKVEVRGQTIKEIKFFLIKSLSSVFFALSSVIDRPDRSQQPHGFQPPPPKSP